MAIPRRPEHEAGAAFGAMDFNDMAAVSGLGSVREAIEAAASDSVVTGGGVCAGIGAPPELVDVDDFELVLPPYVQYRRAAPRGCRLPPLC